VKTEMGKTSAPTLLTALGSRLPGYIIDTEVPGITVKKGPVAEHLMATPIIKRLTKLKQNRPFQCGTALSSLPTMALWL